MAKSPAGLSKRATAPVVPEIPRHKRTCPWIPSGVRQLTGCPIEKATPRDVARQLLREKEVIEIADGERDRLGRDLHDGLCQSIAGIAALSTTLSRKLARQSIPESTDAAEIAQLLNEAVVQARDLARGLNPVELDGIGLVGALETIASTIQSRFQLPCVFSSDRRAFSLEADVETHLYRIAQQAIQNAVDHGSPRSITVTLSFGTCSGTLTVSDDGSGIAADVAEGNGMRSMAYRARLIGASFSVRPALPRGTRVVCEFDLPSVPPETGRHA